MKKRKSPVNILNFYHRALDSIYDGVYFVDKNRKILFWNKGAERISGYSKEEVENHHCYDDVLQHTARKGSSLCKKLCPLLWCMKYKLPRVQRLYLKTKSNQRLAVDIHATPLLNKSNIVTGAIAIFRDATAEEKLEGAYRKIRKLSITDPLTSILNKKAINQKIDTEIKRANRYKFPVSLAMADIDFFKKINDRYGHQIGDSALKQMSKLIVKNVRSVDMVGRMGGDEFIIIFPHIRKENAFIPVERLRQAIEQFKFNKIKTSVCMSFGITEFKEGDSRNSFIKRADENLYKAKNSGRNRVITDSP